MLSRQVFPNSASLAASLAEDIADKLQSAIATKGAALLAVSGGSTPKQMFHQLSEMPVDWERVTVTLVDDRWVAPDSERSNARLVRQTLIQNEAANAQFFPITNAEPTPEIGLPALLKSASELPLPFDVVVLGMGTDGHTASFFPGGDKLVEAIDPEGDALLISMRADGAAEPRITFTYPALVAADHLFLHIEGEEKASVLEQVFEDGQVSDMPVRVFLWQDDLPINLYWCP